MRRRRYTDIDDHGAESAGLAALSKDPINRKLGGVCAGFARFLDIPTFPVRLGAVLSLFIIPQATLIAYGLAYLILDDRIQQ